MPLIQSSPFIDRANTRFRTHGRKHWKKYAAGAAALAAPFAFQRFRGAANALRKGFFNKGVRVGPEATGLGNRWRAGWGAAKRKWGELQGEGLFRRTPALVRSQRVGLNSAQQKAVDAHRAAVKETTQRAGRRAKKRMRKAREELSK